MNSGSRPDSVGGGGVVAEFVRFLRKPTRFDGGEARGVVAGIFSDLHKGNKMFTPVGPIQWCYSWVETLILQNTTNICISCGKIIDQSNYLNSGRFFFTIPGDLEITSHFWRLPEIPGDLAGLPPGIVGVIISMKYGSIRPNGYKCKSQMVSL